MATLQTDRLNGWKAIAAFLKVDVRTARRWEAERALPVHRLPGDARSPVWADPAALAQWMASSNAAPTTGERPPIPPPALLPDLAATPRPRWPLALAIAGALALAGALLAWSRAAPPPAAAFADPQSVRLWHAANHAKASRTPAGLDEAAAAFAELADRNPGNPAPLVGLAETWLLMREFAGFPDEAAFRRGRDAAERALALDPDNPGALRALGFTLFWSEADKPRGLALLKRAVDAPPGTDARSWHWYGNALAFSGQADAALAALDRARTLSPESSAIAADEAHVRFILGEREPAIAALRAITRADPAFIGAWRYLEWDLLAIGDTAGFLEAARAHARLRQDANRLALMDRAEAAAASGGHPALVALLIEDAEARHATTRQDAIGVARLHALAGNRPAVRAWVQRARAMGEPFAHMLDGWPELRPLMRDPALADLFVPPPA